MKYVKCFIMAFLIALVSLFTITTSVNATNEAPASFQMERNGNYLLYGYNYISGIKLNFYRQMTTTGKIVYCIERTDSFTKQLDTYTKAEMLDAGYAYILEHGYPNVSLTGNNDQDYWLTETALWIYMDPNNTLWRNFDLANGKYKGVYSNNVVIINNLVTGARSASYKSYSMTLNRHSDTFTLDQFKTAYTSSAISVTGSNLGTYNLTLSNAPTGTKIVDSNGNVKNSFNAGDVFYVKIPYASVSQSTNVTVNVSANPSYYVAYRYNPSIESTQSVAALYPEKLSLNDSLTIQLNYKKPVETVVEINKIAVETNSPLAGATLVLKNSSGQEIRRWETTGQPYKITGLDFGTYTIQEIDPPQGYELNTNTVSFTLTEANYSQNINFYNSKKKTASVKILKISSETEKPLAGATLVVKDSKGNVVDRWISTEDYHLIPYLSQTETYYLSEEKAPEGYQLNPDVVKFTVKEDDSVVTLNFSNTPDIPVNPPTGVEDFLLPSSIAIIGAGLGINAIKKKNPLRFY